MHERFLRKVDIELAQSVMMIVSEIEESDVESNANAWLGQNYLVQIRLKIIYKYSLIKDMICVLQTGQLLIFLRIIWCEQSLHIRWPHGFVTWKFFAEWKQIGQLKWFLSRCKGGILPGSGTHLLISMETLSFIGGSWGVWRIFGFILHFISSPTESLFSQAA